MKQRIPAFLLLVAAAALAAPAQAARFDSASAAKKAQPDQLAKKAPKPKKSKG